MNLAFDRNLIQGYTSNSQIARVLTENWVLNNSYCPSCGENPLMEFENNRPVADFYCKKCNEEFELKSKSGKLANTITDGAYSAMIERINSENNPNFFFLTYTKDWSVNDFLIIPKQFFTSEIIIKRPPLKETARRAGWVGCNIDISKVSDAGKVFLVKNSQVINQEIVKESFNKTLFLRQQSKASKGWILDIMACVDAIKKDNFTLEDVYKFEGKLQLKYPNNHFIKDKIRQQLQILRDKGIIEFTGRGKYKKINYEKL
ncbi:DpnI domain-containing protein [Capnocytophaga stomatis]|uniref:DpnI domain-containing protein n=1 Tax=Capnocytophaga stomatis TaxID=1848904 RepID=A0ABW8QBI8_9FLAO|nr:DpnI domain-containing protein [Capnocytophaga stomatis]GIJ93758.1 type-2 restriction enzyme DpnI [Capnocytophaga stomatis]GIJ96004.1 type-2 restriction enzyme DpnI [Capnocytophaga stomatis]GIM49781.1 type-2 restriction enzyme DpnI [Capnocytophaga stomatis]